MKTNVKTLLKASGLLILLVLLSASKAAAEPITAGVWSSVTNVRNDQDSFWDWRSWDCTRCNVGYVLTGDMGLADLEYLNDAAGSYVPFWFEEPTIAVTKVSGNTAWTNGVLGRDADGAFTYDSGTGRLSNSRLSPQQYALFRQVGVETTQYFMGIEDILIGEEPNDRDYNDYVVSFTLPNQSVPELLARESVPDLSALEPVPETSTVVPVPEPSTLVLAGMSIFGMAARKMRRLTRTKTSAV